MSKVNSGQFKLSRRRPSCILSRDTHVSCLVESSILQVISGVNSLITSLARRPPWRARSMCQATQLSVPMLTIWNIVGLFSTWTRKFGTGSSSPLPWLWYAFRSYSVLVCTHATHGIDTSRSTTPLCSASATVTAQETPERGDTRTVRP